MKAFVLDSLLLMLAVAAGGLVSTGCGGREPGSAAVRKAEQLYTCGMHPQVVQSQPGNCPICGMKLTPMRKESPGGTGAANADSKVIALEPATTQIMGVRTAMVTRGPLRRVIRTVGAIDYDETALTDVNTKFKGWIEKLYVNATGQLVMRNDPLFEIYSPELYSAQQEYLLALGEDGQVGAPDRAASHLTSSSPPNATNDLRSMAADPLQASALTKLKFFDISAEQIAELERTRQPRKTLRILAPQDGFVMEKMVVQGQMVEAGMKTYRLADLGLVWVQAQIYEQDLAYIKLGQEATVTLSYLPDREFRGRVTYLYPNVDEKTRTARVRMEFHNPGYFLKPGMFATVQVSSELEPSALLVPDMAILRSGEKTTVFVALEGGRFDPRSVTLGPQAENDTYQVLSGLKEGERIVTSGQFLLDSESQLREAIQKMRGGAADEGPASGKSVDPRVLSAPASNAVAAFKYICPMPEHVSIEYDRPGKCPICGMTLVPVTAATLARLQPGGKLLFYTCPMPEHNDVHSDKPGKCAKCGMTLIPVMEPPPLSGSMTNGMGPGKTQTVPVLYTCPMASHADVVSEQPGKCPKCEMELVPTSTVAHGKIAEQNWRQARADSRR